MNKLYVIVPLILTLAFGGVYVMHSKDSAARQALAASEAAKAADAEAAKKADAERQAKADADKRAAERLAEETRKEEEKAAAWAATGKQIATDTAGYQSQAAKYSEELQRFETELAAHRAEKDSQNQSVFDAAKALEEARVQKRNAELEIQRLVEMTARKAGTTLGAVTAIP
jgi:hypothetical protein